MDVLSACPLRVGSIQWQPRPGTFLLTVVCKATFELLPGVSVLAADQDPPNETDDHWNDDDARSLHAASDLVPFKRGADVVLVGHAYAPRMEPVASLTARLVVGELDKAIDVYADRAWTAHGELRDAAQFTRMPLRYERAGGGPETWNPVGVRADARPDLSGHVAIPNLQPPGSSLIRAGEAVPPVGFGPIAVGWPGRGEQLIRSAGGWDPRKWSEQPLPVDIDAGLFNVAPVDQQVSEIRSDATITLENLDADHARLVTRLPGVVPHAVIERPGASAQEVRLRCDTLCIDTDRRVCTLVWRGLVVLSRADEPGRVTITADLIEEPTTPADDDDIETTFATGEPAAVEMLPFVGKLMLGGRLTSGERVPVAEAPPPPEPAWEIDDQGTSDESSDGGTQAIRALPFAFTPPHAVLPFVPPALAAPAPIEPPKAAWIPSATPFTPVSQYLSAPPVRAVEPGLPPTPVGVEAAPPEMLGPLAFSARPVAPVVVDEAPALAPEVAPVAPEPPALPLKAFPLERCAAIAAALAHRPPDRARILERHELSQEQWAALDEHWTAELRAEVDRGKTALLSAHDAAYVAELERLRGPIRVDEMASLLVAAERGQSDRALAELDLPRGALLRVKRVWLVKCAEDLPLGAAVRGAVEDARDA
ncbi:MAG: DUF2169 domain-containing protein [Byssovorax sp.]